MRWKQFFTPVESINTDQAKKIIEEDTQGNVTLLDVRQPNEYDAGHIPGAKLIPLPQLSDRIGEIDPAKPTIVYCAVGGRSRGAAQMLSGRDFSKVYNLSGGIKAWEGKHAAGTEEQGLYLFSGKESPDQVLTVAYSLEKGLRDFYQSMAPMMDLPEARDLFHRLSAIEINHQRRIFEEYCRITGKQMEMDDFDRDIASPAMEGGIETDEFMKRYGADINSPSDVIDMAMSIEAQALDLYSRAAEDTADPESRKALTRIAAEEKEHLRLLGDLFEQL